MGKNRNKTRNRRKRENRQMLLLNEENIISKTKEGFLSSFSKDVEKLDDPRSINNEQDYLSIRTVALKKTSKSFCENYVPSSSLKHEAISKVKILQPKNEMRYFNKDDSTVFGENIYTSVKKYQENLLKFRQTYMAWKKEREDSIQKLKTLRNRVHSDQLLFNKANLFLKETNVVSRQLKSYYSQSIPINFMASIATLTIDAVSSVTSVAQAFNVDGYMQTFSEIMEYDAEITKPLYDARSLCLKEYYNVEEVVRTFHSNTFSNSVEKISEALNIEELWSDIKNAHGADSVTKIINGMDTFFKNNSATELMENIYYSIQNFVDGNPAVLAACGSAGKVCYDVYDIWGPSLKLNKFKDSTRIVANKLLLRNEIMELDKLRTVTNNSKEVQAKLEYDINTAISMLQEEMNEIAQNVEEIDCSNGNMSEIDL